MKSPLLSLTILLLCLLNSGLKAQEAQETPDFATEITYEVAFVPPLLSANVYSDASERYPIGSLFNGTILEFNGAIDTEWFGIKYEEADAWIHQDYVIGNLNPMLFCQDSRIAPLIANLQEAVRNHDGQALANLIAPAGLYLGLQGNTVHLSSSETRNIFEDHQQRYFGNDPNTGNAIIKTLADDIVLRLERDLLAENITIACQDNQDSLSDNSVFYAVSLPNRYEMTNFYSVMRVGAEGYELDWGAWGIGISYWQDEPKIIALGHYTWVP